MKVAKRENYKDSQKIKQSFPGRVEFPKTAQWRRREEKEKEKEKTIVRFSFLYISPYS